jgi:hypothetical protein
MKQVIIILAMLVLTISANSQNVSLWINGQAYAYPATQLVDVPGVGQMTAQQAMQYYPQPQQQPVQLPVTGGNYQQNQLNDLNNQLTLDNKALQNKLLKKQISKMNWDIGTNAVTTLINGLVPAMVFTMPPVKPTQTSV